MYKIKFDEDKGILMLTKNKRRGRIAYLIKSSEYVGCTKCHLSRSKYCPNLFNSICKRLRIIGYVYFKFR